MIEIKRIEKACSREAFCQYVFTGEERRQAGERISMLAGSFAVKEAVAKAFGTGFRGFTPLEVEVLRDERGKPYVNLTGNAEKLRKQLGIDTIHVSITNTAEYAAAFTVAEKGGAG